MWWLKGLSDALRKAQSVAVSKVCAVEHLTTANQTMGEEGEIAPSSFVSRLSSMWRLRPLTYTFSRAGEPIHIVNLDDQTRRYDILAVVTFLHHTTDFSPNIWISRWRTNVLVDR